MTINFNFSKSIFSWLLLLLLYGCGEGGQLSEQETQSNSVQGGITKGVLVGATVNAYPIAIDGTVDRATLIASAVTDVNGLFQLNLPSERGYLLLESSAGEFIDETDQNPDINLKRKIIFSENEGLKTVLPPNYSTVSLTIISQSIYEKTLHEFGDNFYTVFDKNVENFILGLGFNPLQILAADPVDPDQNSSQQSMQYALMAGGLANIANQVAISLGFPLPSHEIIQAVILDFSDGNIDGTVSGVPVQVGGVNIPSNLDLDNAISRFRNNNFVQFSSTSLPEINYQALEEGANPFPVVRAGSDLEVYEGTAVELEGSATDADGSIVSVQWTQTAGVQVTLSATNSLTTSFVAPLVEADETVVLMLTAIDNDGGSSSDSITITVRNNQLPIVDAGIDSTVDELALVSLNGSATDADGTIVSVEWTQTMGPTVNLTDRFILNPSFTAPLVGTDQTLEFKLTAIDDHGGVGEDNVSITVHVNVAPNVSAGSDQTVDEQSLVSLAGSANDADGVVVSTSWNQLQGIPVSLNNSTSLTPTFTSPSISSDEVLVFELTATDDDGLSASSSVTINVHANLAPTVDAGIAQSVDEKTTVSLSGSAVDSDGSIVSVSWQQTLGIAVTLNDPASLTPTFLAPDLSSNQTFRFELTVTDNHGDSSSDTVEITVIANLPPSFPVPPSNQTVGVNLPASLTGTAVDSDGSVVSYQWVQTSGPAVTLSGANSQTATFTTPTTVIAASLDFSLTATDNDGDTTTVTTNVIVQPVLISSLTFPDPGVSGCVTAYAATKGYLYVHQFVDLNCDASNFNDLTGLSALESMDTLLLAATSTPALSNISGLAGLKYVTTLHLNGNLITDISPLSSMTGLTTLWLHSNSINNISTLSAMGSLNKLLLSNNSISDTSPISGLTSLTELELANNGLSNLSPLTGLTALNKLWLDNNSINDISALTNLTSVTDLQLQNNSISNLSPLSGMSGLLLLNIASNSISDVTPLSGLTSINKLLMNDNSISDISSLSGLTSLGELNFSNNSITNLAAISGMTSMLTLYTDNNGIVNIGSLSSLNSLNFLSLGNNSITDVSSLNSTNFPAITYLSVNGNATLAVFTGIETLTTLGTLDIRNTSADCGDLTALQAGLTTTTILENFGGC